MKQSKKWMLVALALLAMVALPLVGCKNDSVSEPVRYTVTFNTDGGSTVQSQTVESGQKVPEPAEPTKNSHFFDGWYSDEEFTNKYEFNTPVTGSFTLYAKWVEGTEITPTTVEDVINNLTGEGPHTLVVTGEWSADDLLAIRTALEENPTVKVNLDLSKVSGLTEIGNYAFYDCSNLTSITIPASVKTIGVNAFYGCSKLATVTVGVESKLETINDSAFYECSSLESITIPASVTTIGVNAFYGCSKLATVTVGVESKLETINDGAFYECSSLESITIPASVQTIGIDAFYGCSNLTTVTMKATTPPTLEFNGFGDRSESNDFKILVPNVDNYKSNEAMIKGWDSYKDKIGGEITPTTVSEVISKLSGDGPHTLVVTGEWTDGFSTLANALKDESKKVNLDLSKVSGLTTIGGSAFVECSSLTSITIPASVTTIMEPAFLGCSKLTTVTFENESKLETIGDHAFNGCSSLTSITIPASVKTIGESAFGGCSKLTTVTMEATTPPTLGVNGFGVRFESNDFKILVPNVDNYKSDEAKTKGWEPYFDKIKDQTS